MAFPPDSVLSPGSSPTATRAVHVLLAKQPRCRGMDLIVQVTLIATSISTPSPTPPATSADHSHRHRPPDIGTSWLHRSSDYLQLPVLPHAAV
eukprot:1181158-Prorocentrum_minimum.AAC.1